MGYVLILIVLLSIINNIYSSEENLGEVFKKNELIPDILDTPPDALLTVKYGSDNVNLGNELTPTQVKDKPTITWNADPNKFFLLSFIDPDALNRKEHIFREYNHWLVGNIPGDDVENGDLIADYIGAGPPKGTGFHRYTFLIYEQPSKLTFDEPRLSKTSGDGRAKFEIRKFAKKYNLGQPIAGNFFNSQYDSYV